MSLRETVREDVVGLC